MQRNIKLFFDDGHVDWITVVNDSHPKVREYLELVSQKVEVHSVECGRSFLNLFDKN